LGLEQRLADTLGGEDRAARAIDADDQRLDALVTHAVLDAPGNRVAAGRSGSGFAVDDQPRDRHHTDRAARLPVDDVRDVGAKFDLAERGAPASLAARKVG